ncbi:hypothetical protein PybrP1_002501, partial [[Pythium] brassicae (nom. inval.)]
MEDTFDSGKHGQVGSKAVEFRDADEATDGEDSDDRDDEDSDEGMGEHATEPASTSERPQWQQRQSSSRQPQRPQQPNVEYPPGSKRHLRTHSLEALSEPPVEKRYGRVGRTSGASSTPAQGPRSSLDDMSSLLVSIEEEEEEEEEEERAHVVYSVGELPT